MIEKGIFLKEIDRIIYEKNIFPSLNPKDKAYTTKRCEEVIDLIIECENRDILIIPDEDNIDKIVDKIEDYLKNFQSIREIMNNLKNMYDTMKKRNGTKLDFRKGRDKYRFLRRHISTELGILYSSLCEVIKGLLCTVIQFKKEIHGIGSLKYQLKKEGLQHDFFRDIDIDIRNAFSHLDYHFDVDNEVFFIGESRRKITYEELLEKSYYLDKISFAIQTVLTLTISYINPGIITKRGKDNDYHRLKTPS